ncbi:MAG: hypothetical protein EOO61_00915 [Hymenobacter sp.]|nr:MAG: hypothetical protein EOO61_00915 [Hymenobacter sp.]
MASLSDTLLEVAPKLHQDINSLQRNQLEVNAGRLLLNAMLLFVFPFTFVALLANSIPRIYGNYKLRKLSARYVQANTAISPTVELEVLKGVKRTLPIVIYHCISGQISIWLISLFGTTDSIAQIGALGRLSMIFTVFSALFSTLIIPRFSRLMQDKNIVLKYFILAQISSFIIGTILFTSVWIFSSQILWLVGPKYLNLKYELLLVCGTNSISLIGNICSQLIVSRGWFMKPYYFIGINFLLTTVFIAFFKISSLSDVLYYGLTLTIILYIATLVFGLLEISKLSTEHNEQ